MIRRWGPGGWVDPGGQVVVWEEGEGGSHGHLQVLCEEMFWMVMVTMATMNMMIFIEIVPAQGTQSRRGH